MDKLKHMKTFMLVVEEGGIVHAARRLNISKAAASKQLIELEANLNTQLINRTTRLLKLTDIGELFYESLKNVFSALQEAESMITHANKTPVGKLRIASHRHFGEKFIINHLQEFSKLYPELTFDIELNDRFPDLDKENFDIVCGVNHEGPDHLVRRRIATIHHILCASPEFIAKFGMPKTPEDLKNLCYITHSFRDPDILIMKNKEIFLDYFIQINDAQAMLNCALQGLGFIKIFNYFVDEHIANGNLVELLKEYREPPKSLYLFYKQQKFLPSKIRVFIDFLCRKINEDKIFLLNKNDKERDNANLSSLSDTG